MGVFVAQRLIKLLIQNGHPVKGARVGILGLTFKEDVPDLRNSRVPDIIAELRDYGIEPLVHDALADPEEAQEEYGVRLSSLDALSQLHALVVAVPHRDYFTGGSFRAEDFLAASGILVDIKSAIAPDRLPESLRYWSL